MRYKDIKPTTQSQEIVEIRMAPSNLRQLAAQTGARAGMEFELVVPGVESPDADLEPDYDEDTRVSDIDSIIEFFSGGEHDVNSSRQINNLSQSLLDQYQNYSMQEQESEWKRVREDVVREYIEENYWDQDAEVERILREEMDLSEEEAAEVMSHAAGIPRLHSSREVSDLVAQDKLFAKYQEALKLADDELDAKAEESNDSEDTIYQEAYDEWFSSYDSEVTENDFLRDEGYRFMSDIERDFDISWPHLTSTGGEDAQEIVDDFERAIGRPAIYNTEYHGGNRGKDNYVVEPDASINTGYQESGLEFISPPLSIDDMITDLGKVAQWAGSVGAYTNKSTGLHINVSVPNYSFDKLDYVKLALLLGDAHVLAQFGRTGNTYARAAMGKIKERVSAKAEELPHLLDLMRQGLALQASKAIHTGFTVKYTSINTKSGYVEFRSPGGDWLSEDLSKVENTLLRFVVALDAATDPEKYRTEYLKKLYQLLSPSSEDDPIAYFARYAAGQLPTTALKSFIKQIQRQRQAKKSTQSTQPPESQMHRWQVGYGDDTRTVIIRARDRNEAIAFAMAEVPEWRLGDASRFMLHDMGAVEEPSAATPTDLR